MPLIIINEMSSGMYGGMGYMNPPSGYGMEAGVMPPSSSAHHRSENAPFYDYQPTNYERYHEPPPLPPQSQPPAYDKYYGKGWGEPSEPKQYSAGPSSEQQPSITLLQRLSALIKSQLPHLQGMSMGVTDYRRPHDDLYRRRSRSRSRDRDRDRNRRSPPQMRRRDNSRSPPRLPMSSGGGGNSSGGMDWLCPKCSFSNYEWRDRCKRCNESKAAKNFMPGPEDWRCNKCNNINYARRLECNRCKAPRESK